MPRFSLKWILAGTVYAAVAAAALSQPGWAYAEALWLVGALLLVYAIALARYGRGVKQACATGFAVAAMLYLACTALSSAVTPVQQLLTAFGVTEWSAYAAVPIYYASPPTVANSPAVSPSGPYRPAAPSYPVVPPVTVYPVSPMPAPAQPAPIEVAYQQRYRATSALLMMAFALAGSLVGRAAYRTSECAASPTSES